MYEIGVIATFEAAHRLVGDFGPATRTHGHSYRIEVVARGERLAADGTLCDLTTLQRAVDVVCAEMHYQELNALGAFTGMNPTAEQVARVIWECVAAALIVEPALGSLMVRVWENDRAFAARDEALPQASASSTAHQDTA